MKQIRLTGKGIVGILLLLIFAAVIGAGVYYYNSYQKLLKNPDVVTAEEAAWLQRDVGKLMILPDETPSTATVLDKDKLQGQDFFAKAENGDKILIYSAAKKAILYRPSSNKIIEVMPVSPDDTQSSTAGTTTPNTNATQ
jgi:hypothetical protein